MELTIPSRPVGTLFKSEDAMKRPVLALIIPTAIISQGVPGGIEHGSREGERAAGPIGGIVGGAIGGVVGGVNGVLDVDQRACFHSYVVEKHVPSYTSDSDVRVEGDLPGDGFTYYDVPPEYGTHDYRYTVVNGRTVSVDPPYTSNCRNRRLAAYSPL